MTDPQRPGLKLRARTDTRPYPNLHVVQGDATDRTAVSHAMKGAGAVISTLGATGPLIAEATRAIVAVAKQEDPSALS